MKMKMKKKFMHISFFSHFNLGFLGFSPCQNKFLGCIHSNTVFVSGDNLDTYVQYLSICDFLVVDTVLMNEKFRFNGYKYGTCDR